jgi:hypothetical protein
MAHTHLDERTLAAREAQSRISRSTALLASHTRALPLVEDLSVTLNSVARSGNSSESQS